MNEFYIEVPTNDNGVWTTTIFETRNDFKDFVLSMFIKLGKLKLTKLSFKFNEQARKFNKLGYYTDAPDNSIDFLNYWGTKENEHILSEKSKCRKGVIIKDDKNTFYLTRDYYFWINFLPIFDKEKKKFDFPNIWDSQYYACLYELLAELNYKHVALLKKRQWGNSYLHCAKILNQFWFESGVTLKVGASLKNYINENGIWKFFNEYRNFLNKNTGWYRACDPDKTLTWQQRQKVTTGDKDSYTGNMSTLLGNSFDKDPTSGVGGNVTYFYHEEAGIAPKMGTTYEYIRPALSSGMITTGTFIAAGSVGDLEQCQPLKKMMLFPIENSIYAIETDLLDDKGTIGYSGLFIPEHWSMPPYIDRYGNSILENPTEEQDEDILANWIALDFEPKDYKKGRGSLQAIHEERVAWKKDLDPGTYQLRISQKPINIHEAFAYRKESIFPLGLINRQLQRIEEKEYFIEYVDLEKNNEGKIEVKKSNRLPIIDFPITATMEDKSGVICMHERRCDERPAFGTYYASIDPVKEGKTTSSESVCSIYIYKTTVEVAKMSGKDIENYLERDKIVAWWSGRFDDLKKTHERLELMIEYYNAWTIVEKNVSEFITYMQNKKKQHYLVPRNQLLSFNKDQKGVSETYQEYGWNNSTAVFQHLLSYTISFLKEELDQECKPDGTVVKTTYGIERIPDMMLLKEMAAYQNDKGNYDRLVAFAALIAFATIQNANRGFLKRTEKTMDLEKPNKLRNFIMGDQTPQRSNPWAKPTGAFRNIR